MFATQAVAKRNPEKKIRSRTEFESFAKAVQCSYH